MSGLPDKPMHATATARTKAQSARRLGLSRAIPSKAARHQISDADGRHEVDVDDL